MSEVKRISVQSSNSPSGGGSVRVYVGTKLAWTKRLDSIDTWLRAEAEVRLLLRGMHGKRTLKLRLV